MLLFQIHQNFSGYHTVIEQLLTLGISNIKNTPVPTEIKLWLTLLLSTDGDNDGGPTFWGFSASERNWFTCKAKKKAADRYSLCSQLSQLATLTSSFPAVCHHSSGRWIQLEKGDFTGISNPHHCSQPGSLLKLADFASSRHGNTHIISCFRRVVETVTSSFWAVMSSWEQ